MKHLIYLFLLACAFSFTACDDGDETTDQKWKDDNSRIYNEIVTNEDWHEIQSPPGVPGGVYYRAIRNGAGTENPIETASVKILYKGYFLNDKEKVFETGTSGVAYKSYVGFSSLPEQGKTDVFYVVWEGAQYKMHTWLSEQRVYEEGDYDIAADFRVNALVRGLGVALQNMKAGDIREICVPYELGYGSGGLSSGNLTLIEGYSTLFFEVELLAIDQYPGQ